MVHTEIYTLERGIRETSRDGSAHFVHISLRLMDMKKLAALMLRTLHTGVNCSVVEISNRYLIVEQRNLSFRPQMLSDDY